jgi:hypothetical protein
MSEMGQYAKSSLPLAATRRFSADSLPRFGTISNVTLAPSGRPSRPALFDGRNMDENVLAAAIRCDEAITLLAVKPFHCPTSHVALPLAITIAAVERRFAALGQAKPAGANRRAGRRLAPITCRSSTDSRSDRNTPAPCRARQRSAERSASAPPSCSAFSPRLQHDRCVLLSTLIRLIR